MKFENEIYESLKLPNKITTHCGNCNYSNPETLMNWISNQTYMELQCNYQLKTIYSKTPNYDNFNSNFFNLKNKHYLYDWVFLLYNSSIFQTPMLLFLSSPCFKLLWISIALIGISRGFETYDIVVRNQYYKINR